MIVMPDGWELLGLLCKFLVYLGLAGLIGGSLSLFLYSDGSRRTTQAVLRYILLTSLLGFQAALLNYLLEIGRINGAGWRGMFDRDMASLLLDTQLGETTLMRLGLFLLSFLLSLFCLRYVGNLTRPPRRTFYRRLLQTSLIAGVAGAMTFSLIGHVSALETVARAAIVVHVIAMSAWIGALYPLLRLTRHDDLAFLQATMKRFGQHALLTVGLLLASGIYLVFQVIHSTAELLQPYGLALLCKLLLVTGLLAIAGLNKWLLVPASHTQAGCARLRLAIRGEMLVVSLLLGVTTYLSSVVGPAMH